MVRARQAPAFGVDVSARRARREMVRAATRLWWPALPPWAAARSVRQLSSASAAGWGGVASGSGGVVSGSVPDGARAQAPRGPPGARAAAHAGEREDPRARTARRRPSAGSAAPARHAAARAPAKALDATTDGVAFATGDAELHLPGRTQQIAKQLGLAPQVVDLDSGAQVGLRTAALLSPVDNLAFELKLVEEHVEQEALMVLALADGSPPPGLVLDAAAELFLLVECELERLLGADWRDPLHVSGALAAGGGGAASSGSSSPAGAASPWLAFSSGAASSAGGPLSLACAERLSETLQRVVSLEGGAYAMALFPLRPVLQRLTYERQWGECGQILSCVEQQLLGAPGCQPPRLAADLFTVLASAATVGTSPPFPKDSLPLALRVHGLLSALSALHGEGVRLERAGAGAPAGAAGGGGAGVFAGAGAGAGPAHQLPPQHETMRYNLLMRLCIRQFKVHGDRTTVAHAPMLLREMRVAGHRPSPASWAHAILALGLLGKPDKAEALVVQMQRVGCAPAEVACHALVEACSAAGDIERAAAALDKMRTRAPWGVARQLSGLAEELPSAGAAAQAQAQTQTQTLLPRTLPPHWGSFSWWRALAASVVARSPSDAGAEAAADWMQQHGGPTVSSWQMPRSAWVWPLPESSSYSSLMRLCGDRLDTARIKSLYVDMVQRGVRVDMRALSVIAETLAETPFGARALRRQLPRYMPASRALWPLQESRAQGFPLRVRAPSWSWLLLDLHGLTRPLAKAAVQAHLRALGFGLLRQDELRSAAAAAAAALAAPAIHAAPTAEGEVLQIITGIGMGDERSGRKGPVLRDLVEGVLREEGLAFSQPSRNAGMLCVALREVHAWAQRQSPEQRADWSADDDNDNDLVLDEPARPATGLHALIVKAARAATARWWVGGGALR